MAAGSSLADVLDKIVDDLWTAYALRLLRREKTTGHSLFIVLGGSTFVPFVVGLLVANFLFGPIKIQASGLQLAITMFVLACSALSTTMSGAISLRMRESLAATPLLMLVSYLSLKLSLSMILVPRLV